MKPVIQLCRNIMNDNIEATWKMLDSLNINLKTTERELRGKDLFKCVF